MVHVNKQFIVTNILFFIFSYLYLMVSTGEKLFSLDILNRYLGYISFLIFLLFLIGDILFIKQHVNIFLILFYIIKWFILLLLVFASFAPYSIASQRMLVGKIDDFAFYRQHVIPDPGAKIIVYQKEKFLPFLLSFKTKKHKILIEEDEYFFIKKLDQSHFELKTSRSHNQYIFDKSTLTINPKK